jgi:hypothetical protein
MKRNNIGTAMMKSRFIPFNATYKLNQIAIRQMQTLTAVSTRSLLGATEKTEQP